MMDMIIRFFEIVVMVISICFLLWIAISWVDVLIHNLSEGGWVYPHWNFFAYFI